MSDASQRRCAIHAIDTDQPRHLLVLAPWRNATQRTWARLSGWWGGPGCVCARGWTVAECEYQPLRTAYGLRHAAPPPPQFGAAGSRGVPRVSWRGGVIGAVLVARPLNPQVCRLASAVRTAAGRARGGGVVAPLGPSIWARSGGLARRTGGGGVCAGPLGQAPGNGRRA